MVTCHAVCRQESGQTPHGFRSLSILTTVPAFAKLCRNDLHDVQSAAGTVVGMDSSTGLQHTLRPLNQLVQLCTSSDQITNTEALLPLNETLRFRHIVTHGSALLHSYCAFHRINRINSAFMSDAWFTYTID